MKTEQKLEQINRPAGYFIFGWLDGKNSARNIVYTLIFLCLGLFLADFFYHRHGHFELEELPGFFSIYGFVMFSIVILGAKSLRFFVKRTENYYSEKSVDSEEKLKIND